MGDTGKWERKRGRRLEMAGAKGRLEETEEQREEMLAAGKGRKEERVNRLLEGGVAMGKTGADNDHLFQTNDSKGSMPMGIPKLLWEMFFYVR